MSNVLYAVQSKTWKRQNDIILFGAWFGEKFADNSRFLFQYLDKNKKELKLSHVVWVTRNETLCNQLTLMGYEAYMIGSEESTYYHKKAGMHILCNASSDRNGSKPDIQHELSFGAKRVNLWHGVGVVKGVGCDSLEYKRKKELRPLIYKIKEGLEKFKLYRLFVQEKGGWGDFYFLSPTPTTTKQFKRFSYIPEKNFIESLYPRTCSCIEHFSHEKEVITEMNKYSAVILYLPTFRTGQNRFDFTSVANRLQNILLEHNILWIQKAHSASGVGKIGSADKNILSLNHDFDINVLIPHIDILITDYSSAASDARFFRKPVLFYVPDIDDYMNGENGVTEEAEELLSGPKFYDEEQLQLGIVESLKNPNSAKPDNYEMIRSKYWGKDKDMKQIWIDICKTSKFNGMHKIL